MFTFYLPFLSKSQTTSSTLNNTDGDVRLASSMCVLTFIQWCNNSDLALMLGFRFGFNFTDKLMNSIASELILYQREDSYGNSVDSIFMHEIELAEMSGN